MSAVIKAGRDIGHDQVRTFAKRSASEDDARTGTLDARPEDPALAALRADNDHLRVTLSTLEVAAEQAVEAAYEEGRKTAAENFRRDETAALKALQVHLGEAFGLFQTRLSSWDTLALAVAQVSLSKVLSGADDYNDVLTRMIGLQLESVRRDSVISVKVNPQDFPDPDALKKLASGLAHGGLVVIADAQVAPGGCVLQLRLGQVESALDAQWDTLISLFEDMASRGALR